MGVIPEVTLSSGHAMPLVGLGTASFPPATPEAFRTAMMDAIALGYRHFDTASLYGTEERLGEAVADAIGQGLVKREELFITSKLWCTDAHADRVVAALRQSLGALKLEYLDLYLVHWPISMKPSDTKFPINKDDFLPIDLKAVWEAMEECQRAGLTKSIGVSNFSCKKLERLLSTASIPPAVNQVEMNPIWQQNKLLDYAKNKGIKLCAYSPLGSTGTPWGTNEVMECDVLKQIALTKGKSVPQVSLKWLHQQGVGVIVKSFRKERLKENIDIFDWELTAEELQKISQIPQSRGPAGDGFVSANGPYKSLEELWDGEI
ncbi:unnamed protein product [Musa acuminata subsp. malaccensis]|uniref:(wild Malaysian banana) hypothetical protein n=1 Tax=Musa acuminata subsp. malaccensis TaxID=214687 RepID=A0A804JV06_MUSAM|nr:PREDICTED: non-functional NADPH-dependent codeinone reductase 2 [Musa acuminata subsp. malaccensis]CAG1856368.1 unnamed protein product [Musa acuminata subsp. malaccensis]